MIIINFFKNSNYNINNFENFKNDFKNEVFLTSKIAKKTFSFGPQNYHFHNYNFLFDQIPAQIHTNLTHSLQSHDLIPLSSLVRLISLSNQDGMEKKMKKTAKKVENSLGSNNNVEKTSNKDILSTQNGPMKRMRPEFDE
jgi:hypothetical protein